jgi:hypothetical protein
MEANRLPCKPPALHLEIINGVNRHNPKFDRKPLMAKFQLHTPETAPEGARDFLSGLKKKMGFVPSLSAVLAENPAVLDSYAQIKEQIRK